MVNMWFSNIFIYLQNFEIFIVKSYIRLETWF